MLGHCLRRWPDIETLLDICILIIKYKWFSNRQVAKKPGHDTRPA